MSQKLTVPHPKKKIDKTTLIVLCVIGVVLLIGCVVLGAAFDYAIGADGSIDGSKISPAFRYVTSHPEVIISAITKKDGYVPKMLFVGVCVIGIFALYKYSEEPKRLHRRGTEHGSAKWADEKEVRALAEKEKKPYQLALRDENGGYLYDDKGEFICADADIGDISRDWAAADTGHEAHQHCCSRSADDTHKKQNDDLRSDCSD